MPEQEEKKVIVRVAYTYFQDGKWDRALDEYKKLVAIDPMDFLVHNMMAEIYARKGEKEQAINEFIKAANLLRATNSMEKAIQAYNHILRLDEENEEAKTKIEEIVRTRLVEADDYVRRGSVKNALELVERLSFKLPNHELLNEKVEELEKLVEAQESNPSVEPAAETTKTVSDSNPSGEDSSEPVQNEEVISSMLALAERYEKKQAYDEAVETYLTILRMQPDNADVHNRITQITKNITQQDKSQEVWSRLNSEKKRVFEKAKNEGKAKPKSDGLSQTAKLVSQAGDFSGAVKEDKSVSGMEKMRQRAEEQLRSAVQDRREREKQQAVPEPATEDFPPAAAAPEQSNEEKENSIQVLLTQAQMYIRQNLLIEAMRLAQNILELDPQNKDVRQILKKIYDKKNL